jgi:hypothetical protein
VESTEFAALRKKLGKTQKQIAQLIGTSLKAIHSYEQGWRTIPAHSERQILFLTAMKNKSANGKKACWVKRKCPKEKRNGCPAWEYSAGDLCWFINGTLCEGKPHKDWKSKMEVCRNCSVYRNQFESLVS